MPDSNRGLILTLAVSALFVVGTTGASELECQSDYYTKGAYQITDVANEHQLPRFDRAWLPCLVERAIASPQARETSEKDQRDLIAQETTALWGFWMAAFAGLTALVTSLGTFLIWRQVALTREAVADTGKATKAIRSANKIAAKAVAANQEANRIAQEALAVQSRAWLAVGLQIIDNVTIEESDNSVIRAKFKVHVTNMGNSPATNMRIELKIVEMFRDDIDVLQKSMIESGKLETGINRILGSTVYPNIPFSQDHSIISEPDSLAALRAINPKTPAILAIVLIVVVQYDLPGSAVRRTVSFVNTICKNSDRPVQSFASEADLPLAAEALRFAHSVFGRAYID